MKLHHRRDSRRILEEHRIACLAIAKTEELRVRVRETAGRINERVRTLFHTDASRTEAMPDVTHHGSACEMR
jgi:hypothetical protein